jgi:RNA polymerase sigma-70 factor, ECF subfamily
LLIKQSDLNDEELVKRAQSGKQEAFTALYERYLPGVYARVRFKVPPEEAEDLTQEIFIAVMKSLSSFRGQSKFSTWLWALTNHKILDFYRSRKGYWNHHQQMEQAEDQTSLADERSHIVQQDDLMAVQYVLQRLPQPYQEIILLRFVDEVPFHEIARLKGQSLEATKSLFRRSIAALRKEMERCNE